MTVPELTNLLWALASVIAAATGAWNVIISKRGVAVSTGNQTTLVDVQKKQLENKIDITAKIQEVQHDIKNGGGQIIADRVIKQIKPVLEETGKIISDQVAQNAADVAAVLAEKGQTWDGVERRFGPADRREHP